MTFNDSPRQAAKPAIIRDLQRRELVLQAEDTTEKHGGHGQAVALGPDRVLWSLVAFEPTPSSKVCSTGSLHFTSISTLKVTFGVHLKAHCLSKKREGSHMSLA